MRMVENIPVGVGDGLWCGSPVTDGYRQGINGLHFENWFLI